MRGSSDPPPPKAAKKRAGRQASFASGRGSTQEFRLTASPYRVWRRPEVSRTRGRNRLGASSYRRWIADRDAVSLKKYFYALRPAIALHWLRTRSDPPPMDLPSLRAGLRLPGDLSAAIDDLIARKAARSEMGSGPRIDVLDRFIEAELAVEPGTLGAGRGVPDNTGTLRDANRLFHDLVTS